MKPDRRRARVWWLILAALFVATAAIWWRQTPSVPPEWPAVPGLSVDQTRKLVGQIATIENQERHVAATVWAPELLAQQCGRVMDRLWDTLNATTNRWAVLRAFPWPTVVAPAWDPSSELDHGVSWHAPGPHPRSFSPESWRAFLQGLDRQGWSLSRVELRQLAFATNVAGAPAASRYSFSAWLAQPGAGRRAEVRGDAEILWSPDPSPDGSYPMTRIDASRAHRVDRTGPVPFAEVHFAEVTPPDRSFFIDPILVHDLDGDGFAEIILAAKNRVLRRQPNGGYTASELCPHPPGLIFTALLADLDHDGLTDLICARTDGLVLFRGAAGGTFPNPGEQVWIAPAPLRYGQVITAADVDGDGDLDLWLGQYKTPYERGQMPTPYHAANDGYPAYLLLNEGQGTFHDGTESAQLGPKRHRRTYSASFVDLNADHQPDLVVVSDFAGVDLYLNDGHGRFRDVTDLLPDPLGFGMAHALGDFDGDGEIDLFVTGMHCPAARRLESLGLRRPGFEALDAMRGRMTQGNRLYQRRAERFVFTQLGQSASHSGWSWSPAAGDYDNDGFLDVYIANGHETRQSVVDYEPEFWLTDIYVASSADDLALAAYFGGKFARTRGQGQSYGGYEANRLFLNQQAESFLEIGWLLGVAVEEDSRNAISADLDGDGRLDLVVTTFEAWPRVRQTVRVFHNELPTAGNWIGVHLRPSAAVHPFGATVTATAEQRTWVRLVTSGDSHRSQQPWTVHIGLGTTDRLDRLEVRWPNGRTTAVLNPETGRYHTVHAPVIP